MSLTLDEPLHAVTLTLFLQCLADTCGADLLRVKGIVEVVEEPDHAAEIHGVQHVFHPLRWLTAGLRGRARAAWCSSAAACAGTGSTALLATIEEEVCAARQ